MNKKLEKNTKEKQIDKYKKDKHNMITLAIATIILTNLSVITTIVFGISSIQCVLPCYILTVLFGIFLVLSIMTVRKTKKFINN